MKRLQIVSRIILVIGIICFLLFRFALSVPDWSVRISGIILLISIFVLVFSSVRLSKRQEKQIENRH